MHLVDLGYKLLEHRLRAFLLISLSLRKELRQEEALKLQIFFLPFSWIKENLSSLNILGKTKQNTKQRTISLKKTAELRYSVKNCLLYLLDLGTVTYIKSPWLRMV